MKLPVRALVLFLLGFLLGCAFLAALTGIRSASVQPPAQEEAQALDREDTAALLSAAADAARFLRDRDYQALSAMVHPERGVTFTPYSSVDPEMDQNFSSEELAYAAENEKRYLWGYTDGRGSPIWMTIPEFMDSYIFSQDYTKAPQVAVDQVLISGNALENLTQAYPGCRFVEFSYPGIDPVMEGMDWCSLKLVFEPGETQWLLVGVIHSQWTI